MTTIIVNHEKPGLYGRESKKVPSYAKRVGEQQHITENYETSPPCAHITDLYGGVWCLGYHCGVKGRSPKGQYCYNVLRNGKEVGEMASVIAIKNGKIRIYTETGWKKWTGFSFF